MNKQITLDEFNETYLCGFEIGSVHTDVIGDLYSYYKKRIEASLTDHAELFKTIRSFRFLTGDVDTNILAKYDLKYLAYVMLTGGREAPQELYPFVLPNIMLHARDISAKFGLPQYAAAVQYVNAMMQERDAAIAARKERIKTPLTNEEKQAAKLKLGRKIAATLLQGMVDSDKSVEEIETKIRWPKGKFQRQLMLFINGTHKDLHMISDLALAFDCEWEFKTIAYEDIVPHPSNLLNSDEQLDAFFASKKTTE